LRRLQLLYFCFSVCLGNCRERAGFYNFCILFLGLFGKLSWEGGVLQLLQLLQLLYFCFSVCGTLSWEDGVLRRLQLLYFCFSVCLGNCRERAGFCNFCIFVFLFVWEIVAGGRGFATFATFVFLFLGLFGKLSWEGRVLQPFVFLFFGLSGKLFWEGGVLQFWIFVLEIAVGGWGFATFVFLFFGLFGTLSWEGGVLQLLCFCFSVCLEHCHGRAGFCNLCNFCIYVLQFVGHCHGSTGLCNFCIFVFRFVWEIVLGGRGFATFATFVFLLSVCLGNCRGRAGCGGSRETDTGSSTRLFLCRGSVCKKYRSGLYLSIISYKNIVCNCNSN